MSGPDRDGARRQRLQKAILVAAAAVALLVGAAFAIRSRIIANRFVAYLDVSDHRSRMFVSHVLPRLRHEFGEGLKPRIVVVPMTDDAAPVRGAVAARCAEEQDRQARFLDEWIGAGGGGVHRVRLPPRRHARGNGPRPFQAMSRLRSQ